jgi:hypothetical protein
MTVSGARAGGSYPQWDKLRADIRGDKDTVGEAIADTDFKKLGSDKTFTMKAGYTFWDVAEAIELSNTKYAHADTMDLAKELQKQTCIKDATKVPIGTKLDLSKYFASCKPPEKKPEQESPNCGGDFDWNDDSNGYQDAGRYGEGNGNCKPSEQKPNLPYLDKARKAADDYLKKNDKDKDGKISGCEAPCVKDIVSNLDTDGDKKLNRDELTSVYLFQDDPVGTLVNGTVGAAFQQPFNPFSPAQNAELPKVIQALPDTPLSKADGNISASDRKTSLSFFRNFPALSNLVMGQLMKTIQGGSTEDSNTGGSAGFY